jgi:CheY-like chemotaxis protein
MGDARRILVVDDDPRIAAAVRRALVDNPLGPFADEPDPRVREAAGHAAVTPCRVL